MILLHKTHAERRNCTLPFLIFFLFVFIYPACLLAQRSQDGLETYQPEWIRNGFAVGGPTWETWQFMTRRNITEITEHNYDYWEKDEYEKQMSEDFIKSLAKSGATIYHLGFYKGFGFKAEKEHMDQAARAAAIAHKYGLKVATYIQWSTLCYETFFSE